MKNGIELFFSVVAYLKCDFFGSVGL